MKTLFTIFLLTLSSHAFAENMESYKLNEHYSFSKTVSKCMAYKTLDVIEGTERQFAEKFYRSCMEELSARPTAYPHIFKGKTIGRFHYIMKRAALYANSVRA